MANESIDKILSELNKVELMLKQFRSTGKIPDIERDIVLAKLRNMYEFIYLIQLQEVEKPQAPVIMKEIVEEIQTILKEEEMTILELEPETVPEPVPEPLPVPEPETEPEPELGPKIITTLDPIKETTIPLMDEKTEEVTVTETIEQRTTYKKTESSSQILADKFQDDRSFLNEALAKFQNLQDISRKYQTKPISDISSAISLNEKFVYIKELFNNDGELYKQTIEFLNNAGDFNRAVQYLDGSFKWDFNDFQVQKILELVHRRYMPADE